MKRQPKNSPPPQQQPMASAKGDLRQLRQNSGATVAELKAFLKQLKGKSPQEMLGIVASSQLVRSIGISTALVAIAMVVFTAIPYAMGDKENNGSANTQEAEASGAQPAPTPAQPTPPAPTPEATPPAGDPANPVPAGADLSKLGVGEEKKAPPNVNPLENKKDDFLEGLD